MADLRETLMVTTKVVMEITMIAAKVEAMVDNRTIHMVMTDLKEDAMEVATTPMAASKEVVMEETKVAMGVTRMIAMAGTTKAAEDMEAIKRVGDLDTSLIMVVPKDLTRKAVAKVKAMALRLYVSQHPRLLSQLTLQQGTSYGGGNGGDSDFSGAAQHAQQHAGNSGDGNMFSQVLGQLSGQQGRLQNENINEQQAVQSHQNFYGGGGGGQPASSGSMGSAAAMQALKASQKDTCQ